MPRARKARLSDDVRAQLFAQWHITDMQISHAQGVTRVKHAQWGWMPVERYYGLQKIHDVLPIVEKIIEGGYRMKAQLWGLSVNAGAFGFDVAIPVGLAIPATALLALDASLGENDMKGIALWTYALVGPFGDLITIWAMWKLVQAGFTIGTNPLTGPTGPLGLIDLSTEIARFFQRTLFGVTF